MTPVLNALAPVDREQVATAYDGPVVITGLPIGGREIRIVRPADPDRLLDDPAVLDWNRRDDYMPYWAYLWPGAYLLADVRYEGALARSSTRHRHWHSHFDALEIGCGLGLAGLAALARGRTVLFTDYDQAPLEFVARSAAENGFDAARFAAAAARLACSA